MKRNYYEQTINFLNIALEKPKKSVIELSAMASVLHHACTGMENILKRILSFRQIDIQRTSSSHKDLLTLAVDKHIISQRLSDKLDKYRGFRHFFVHSYGVLLEEEELLPLAENLPQLWHQFDKEINKTR